MGDEITGIDGSATSPDRGPVALRILTWHVHGSYLYYLAHVPHDFFVPVRGGRPAGYAGLPPGPFPWPPNLHEVPADAVRTLPLDCVLFQSRDDWVRGQQELLSPAQRALPRIYLEHDPPREHPTDTRHPVDDPDVLLVHVTHFNALMWDAGRTPVRVIEHGVTVPEGVRYTGELRRGLVAVNNLRGRGRRLGADVFARARAEIPLDLVGIASEAAGRESCSAGTASFLQVTRCARSAIFAWRAGSFPVSSRACGSCSHSSSSRSRRRARPHSARRAPSSAAS